MVTLAGTRLSMCAKPQQSAEMKLHTILHLVHLLPPVELHLALDLLQSVPQHVHVLLQLLHAESVQGNSGVKPINENRAIRLGMQGLKYRDALKGAPGCVKLCGKIAFCIHAAGRKTQFLHPIFTQHRARFCEHPCNFLRVPPSYPYEHEQWKSKRKFTKP